MAPSLESLGQEIVERVNKWGEQAENNPPSLRSVDEFGERIDQMTFPHGWHQLRKFAWDNRLVALGYDKKLKECRRSVQTTVQIMFSAYSASVSCPIAMTDGAVKVLLEHGPKSIKDQVVPRMLGKEGQAVAACGQWMTERIGGSDLGVIETRASLAKKAEDHETYRLF